MTDFSTPEVYTSESATSVKSDGRSALAVGKVILSEESYALIKDKKIKKGDVLTIAEVTGLFGAKKTSDLFAFCRPNTISEISIEFGLNDDDYEITVQAFTKTNGLISVEMEAMTAVSTSCLAIYDMCKSADQSIRITDIRLLSKTGGQKGGFRGA